MRKTIQVRLVALPTSGGENPGMPHIVKNLNLRLASTQLPLQENGASSLRPSRVIRAWSNIDPFDDKMKKIEVIIREKLMRLA